ncbi:MAG: lipopolysaccharide transport periplasmic protein LptA [Xanthomonadales bacterium]|nr:lipopolysaccharide transport periplasmic protein LptA [Xanthomonadales bacterium]
MRARIDAVRLPAILALALCAGLVHGRESDREQPMEIESDYQKTVLEDSGGKGGVTELRGNVRMTQGSLKIQADRATLYQHPGNARDAQGNDVGGTVARVVLTGRRAHLEERQDNGGALIRADAETIDYDADTGIAKLTGDVNVVQQGRGEFSGPQMVYNTRTSEIESDAGGGGRVRLIIQPKAKSPAPPRREAKPDDAPSPGGSA